MIILSDAQVIQVLNQLEASGVNYKPVQEELLDHLCCQIELKCNEGHTFEVALQSAFASFKEDEFKEIQQLILKPKSFFMYRLPLLMAGFLFFLLGSYFIASMPPTDDEDEEIEAYVPYQPDEVIQSVFQTPVAKASLVAESEPPSIVPLKENYRISSGFGMRMHPIYKVKKQHFGIDLAAPIGTPVHATADGEVITVKRDSKGYGTHIIIKHDENYSTLYAQLSEANVNEGDIIKKGTVIGKVGSSGMSTNPHLHYEVMKDGARVDPQPFFTP